MDAIWLGMLVVVVMPLLMALRPLPVFGYRLSLKETLEVCWVTWCIFMGTYVAHIGLKIPFGLSRHAHAPAVWVSVCTSLLAIVWLARIQPNWERAVTRSIIGLLAFTLAVISITWYLALAR